MGQKSYSCSVEAAFDVIGGKWKAMILCRLHPDPKRFGELKRLVEGITEKMLIQQLREMEDDGIVAREAFPEVPPRVVYSLTPLGLSLRDALSDLCAWGTEYMKLVEARATAKAPAKKPTATKPKAPRRGGI